MSRRAKQTKFVALNLRLPPELHKELVKASGSTRSLNAEILGRLQRSFEPEEKVLVRDRTREADLGVMIKRLNKELAETKSKLITASTQSLEDLKRRVEKIEERLRAEK